MLKTSINLIVLATLLFILPGCQEDKLEFTDKEQECMDVTTAGPIIDESGSFLLGENFGLSTNFYLPGAEFCWEGPNGFKAKGQGISFTNIGPQHEGEYRLYLVKGECRSRIFKKNVSIIK